MHSTSELTALAKARVSSFARKNRGQRNIHVNVRAEDDARSGARGLREYLDTKSRRRRTCGDKNGRSGTS